MAKVRAGVERVFARAKNIFGFSRSRYRTLARNRSKGFLLPTAMNLLRMRSLLVLAP
ncbi:transposase [Deltaproteobacteria bacterium PRO3]|nr:transposase [Deltaproteobacteria bacterium PRO3]